MDDDTEYALITAAAAALTDGDMDTYDALKAANPHYPHWADFDYRKAIIEGKTVEELGPHPVWKRRGEHATTTRALGGRDKE